MASLVHPPLLMIHSEFVSFLYVCNRVSPRKFDLKQIRENRPDLVVAPFSAASAAVTSTLAIDVVAAFPSEFALGQYNMFSNSSHKFLLGERHKVQSLG
jgi:hypothetical protein